MAGLVKRIVLCAMMIFFTDNMLSAETVTLSTIMGASASGVKKVWSGSILNPSTSNTTIAISPAAKASKTVIQISGGGMYYLKTSTTLIMCGYWHATLKSKVVSSDNLTSITITPQPTAMASAVYWVWPGDVVANYTVIEYL